MRPYPPEIVIEPYVGIDYFIPAPELDHFVRTTFLDCLSELYNEEHAHLGKAHLGWLWTNVPYVKQMRVVAGQAEKPMFKGGAWQKHRQEMQFEEWFGGIPDFVITLDARYANEASDRDFCALLEHELYHCAQRRNKDGAPKFHEDTDRPVYGMRGHDVEEFVGVVRRYGMSQSVRDLVEAATDDDGRVEAADITLLCGNCGK